MTSVSFKTTPTQYKNPTQGGSPKKITGAQARARSEHAKTMNNMTVQLGLIFVILAVIFLFKKTINKNFGISVKFINLIFAVYCFGCIGFVMYAINSSN